VGLEEIICWKITIGLLIDNHPIPLGSLEVENTIVRIALANVMQYAYGLSALFLHGLLRAFSRIHELLTKTTTTVQMAACCDS